MSCTVLLPTVLFVCFGVSVKYGHIYELLVPAERFFKCTSSLVAPLVAITTK
jgi:hypothetical protein